MPKQSESHLQQVCVRWFRLQYPEYSKLLFAIPNAGKRLGMNGARMKAEGLLAGVPDLFLAIGSNGFNGMFIEMKHGKNKPSNEQKMMLEELKSRCYNVEIIYTLDDFIARVNSYLN